MAYKFQLGEFRASGSIIVEEELTSQGNSSLQGDVTIGDAAADSVTINAGDHTYTAVSGNLRSYAGP
jgi:hypothetical protein